MAITPALKLHSDAFINQEACSWQAAPVPVATSAQRSFLCFMSGLPQLSATAALHSPMEIPAKRSGGHKIMRDGMSVAKFAPCTSIVYIWALKGFLSLLWGLCMYYIDTWTLGRADDIRQRAARVLSSHEAAANLPRGSK